MSRRPNRTRLYSAVSDDVLKSQTSALDAYVAAKWLPLAAYKGCPAPEGPGGHAAPLQTAFERDVVLIPGGRCSDSVKAVKGGACEPAYTPVRKSHGLRSGVDQGSARPSPAASVASSLPCSPPASWESLPPMASLVVTVPPPPSPRPVQPRPLEPAMAVPSDSTAVTPAVVPQLLPGVEPVPAVAAAPTFPEQLTETATLLQAGRWTRGCVLAVLAMALALLMSLYHTADLAARGHWHVVSTSVALLMDTAMAGWAVLQLPCFRKGAHCGHTVDSSSSGRDGNRTGGPCCPPRTPAANCETWSLACWGALAAAVRCVLAWNTYMHTARPAV